MTICWKGKEEARLSPSPYDVLLELAALTICSRVGMLLEWVCTHLVCCLYVPPPNAFDIFSKEDVNESQFL